jgi:hypothetical protein
MQVYSERASCARKKTCRQQIILPDAAGGALLQAPTDWAQVARDAWDAPSWRLTAIEYHRQRPPSPSSKLTSSSGDIWRAAGRCIRRRAPHDALKTFLAWCDHASVERGIGLPIFRTIIQKELRNGR